MASGVGCRFRTRSPFGGGVGSSADVSYWSRPRVWGCASESQKGGVSAPHVVERAITMADSDGDDIGISFGSFTVDDTRQSSNDYSHVSTETEGGTG